VRVLERQYKLDTDGFAMTAAALWLLLTASDGGWGWTIYGAYDTQAQCETARADRLDGGGFACVRVEKGGP